MTVDGPQKQYPTPFQRKAFWRALTALSLVLIGAILVGFIWLFTFVMGFLQPVFVPLAVAGVLGYLLYPLVDKLIARGIPQKRASLIVFVSFVAASGILITSIAIPLSKQAGQVVRNFPTYIDKFEQTLDDSAATLRRDYADHFLLGAIVEWLPETGETGADSESAPETIAPGAAPETPALEEGDAMPTFEPGDIRSSILKQVPVVGRKVWDFVRRSVGGFLGAFGFVIGFALVPIYLFFFLREAPRIRETWSDYLPLRASRFKDEVVGSLTEINGYLIAFFRGQMLVSLIDGLITALVLTVIMPKFGLLIGVLVGILGIIPYLGILMCFIPAVILATVQGAGHDWWMWEGAPWWVLPLVVTIVFIAVNNLDGIFLAPKIVGDSVGLHPFTIIFSVLFWSLLLGGLLGALLAVPLTASLKVLFRRYIWELRVKPAVNPPPDPARDDDAEEAPVA